MINLRCTGRALPRFRLTPEETDGVSGGVLGDWYVNLPNLGPTRFVLCVSERSLLPVVLPARNVEFPRRLHCHIQRMLEAIGVPPHLAEVEAGFAREVVVGKTQNRSVLGVMNDYHQMSKHYVVEVHPVALALSLAETPVGPIGYASPRVRTRELLRERRTPGP